MRARQEKVVVSSFHYENSSELTGPPETVSDWTQVSLDDTWGTAVLGETWGYEMLRFHILFYTRSSDCFPVKTLC